MSRTFSWFQETCEPDRSDDVSIKYISSTPISLLSCSSSYAQSLHVKEDSDRELAVSLLRSRNPGVYIAIPSDLSTPKYREVIESVIEFLFLCIVHSLS